MANIAPDARGIVSVVAGRHDKGGQSDIGVYLSAYTVNEPFRQHRVSRGEVCIERPCLAVFWAIQPDMYYDMFRNPSLGAGGLLPRLLTCKTQALYATVSQGRMVFPLTVAQAYEGRLEELLETYRMHTGEPFVVESSPGARNVIIAYTNRTLDRCRNGEFTDTEEPFVSRWAENAWRMALVFHAAEHGKDAHTHQLSEGTARRAVALVSWFALQQLQVLDETREAEKGNKTMLLLNLVAKCQSVTARLVAKSKICTTVEEAEKLLKEMVQDGHLEVFKSTGQGRPTKNYQRPQRRSK